MLTLGPRELIVGLGSNAENRVAKLREARSALRAHPMFRLLRCSPLYESDAMLPPGAPAGWDLPFLNAACLLEMQGTPSSPEIIAALKAIERSLGRKEAARWAPREIDLDLLAWGCPDFSDATATVPHPGLQERPFALLPALDCAPQSSESPWRFSPPDRVPFGTRLSSEVWPELVGILNVTPDSFSDGRREFPPDAVEAAVEALVRDGATVIDVGAESTRPGATPVTAAEEIQRLAPALERLTLLKGKLSFRLSLDTRHAETAAWALANHSVDWLNDVEGFEDAEMLSVAKASNCTLVFMHSLGVPPQAGRLLAAEQDPTAQVLEWAKARAARLLESGVATERLVFDPGIGFGKTAAQNFEILEKAHALNRLGVRLLIGHSRKRFLDPRDAVPAAQRDLETGILTARLANSGADYLRVHSPATQLRALRLGARLR